MKILMCGQVHMAVLQTSRPQTKDVLKVKSDTLNCAQKSTRCHWSCFNIEMFPAASTSHKLVAVFSTNERLVRLQRQSHVKCITVAESGCHGQQDISVWERLQLAYQLKELKDALSYSWLLDSQSNNGILLSS